MCRSERDPSERTAWDSPHAPVEVSWPPAFQRPADKRPMTRELAEDVTIHSVLETTSWRRSWTVQDMPGTRLRVGGSTKHFTSSRGITSRQGTVVLWAAGAAYLRRRSARCGF